jgi:hypothetical protein
MIGMRRHWGIAEVIGDLRPGAAWTIRDNDYENMEWFSLDKVKPTIEEIEARAEELEAAEPMRMLREIRDWYLQNTDWTQVQDLRKIRGEAWCAAWDKYRQEMRDLPVAMAGKVSLNENDGLVGVVWPIQPKES